MEFADLIFFVFLSLRNMHHLFSGDAEISREARDCVKIFSLASLVSLDLAVHLARTQILFNSITKLIRSPLVRFVVCKSILLHKQSGQALLACTTSEIGLAFIHGFV